MTGQPGKPVYLLIVSEPTIQSFEYVKTIFSEFKTIPSDRIQMTLDTDTIPMDHYKLLEVDSSYIITYGQFQMQNSLNQSSEIADEKLFNKKDNDNLEETDEMAEDQLKDQTVEETFRINTELLEKEYSLTTLNLNKIKIINLKGVIQREDKTITDEDMMFIDKAITKNGEDTDLKKRDLACIGLPHLAQMIMNPSTFSLSSKRLKEETSTQASAADAKPHSILELAMSHLKIAEGTFNPKSLFENTIQEGDSNTPIATAKEDCNHFLKEGRRLKDRTLPDISMGFGTLGQPETKPN